MSETIVIALISAVMAFGTGAGLWQFLTARRKQPIDNATAVAAIAAQAQTMTLAWASELKEDVARLRSENEIMHKDFEALRNEWANTKTIWERWYQGVVSNWFRLRQDEQAPPAPSMEVSSLHRMY